MARNTIRITPIETSTELRIVVWDVTIEDANGCWSESFATQQEVEAFLKGARSALTVVGERVFPWKAIDWERTTEFIWET